MHHLKGKLSPPPQILKSVVLCFDFSLHDVPSNKTSLNLCGLNYLNALFILYRTALIEIFLLFIVGSRLLYALSADFSAAWFDPCKYSAGQIENIEW